jgi:hypothetical protein
MNTKKSAPGLSTGRASRKDIDRAYAFFTYALHQPLDATCLLLNIGHGA